MSDHRDSTPSPPDPITFYRHLLETMTAAVAGYVPLLRAAHHALEPELPAEPERSALLNADAASLPLELWGWTDTLLGDNLLPALAQFRRVASATDVEPRPGEVDYLALWRELDPGAPGSRLEALSADPVALYQALCAYMERVMTWWVLLVRDAEAGVATLLPPEPQAVAFLNSDDPRVKSAALEVWGWSDGLVGEHLIPAIGQCREVASITDENLTGDQYPRGELWRELDPKAPQG